MANSDCARGFVFSRHRSGAEPPTSEYGIASAYASSIFIGDVVKGAADGTIELATGGNQTNLGVFLGCSYVDSQGKQKIGVYWPANTVATNIKALVQTDPDVIWRIQADTATAAAIHSLADWDDGAGSAVTGLSGRELVASASAATDKSVRILGKVNSPDNDWGQYVDVEVQFVEHVMMGVVDGKGGV